MLCQRSGNWETAALEPPYGRGAMFQIYIDQIEPILAALRREGWPIYAGPREVWREVGDREAGQREVFIQDPDGYLLMIAHHFEERAIS